MTLITQSVKMIKSVNTVADDRMVRALRCSTLERETMGALVGEKYN